MLHCMNCSNIFAKAVVTIVKHIVPKQLRETVIFYPGWSMTWMMTKYKKKKIKNKNNLHLVVHLRQHLSLSPLGLASLSGLSLDRSVAKDFGGSAAVNMPSASTTFTHAPMQMQGASDKVNASMHLQQTPTHRDTTSFNQKVFWLHVKWFNQWWVKWMLKIKISTLFTQYNIPIWKD